MSSLKMTFSLASLVLILGLVFVTAPAMAQEIDQIADFGAADTAGPDGTTSVAALVANDNANVTTM